MSALSDLLLRENDGIPLDVAALQLAQVEFPGLPAEPSISMLDSFAAEIGRRLEQGASGKAYVETVNEYLFHELGFHGNEEDYYDPLNSCLNEVLVRRMGIPISLAVVYLEIGRRLRRAVYGIGLPGHFLVQYDDGDYSTYIDPFHGGRLLTLEDCSELVQRIAGVQLNAQPSLLLPVSKRQIVLRMLNNLRAVYFQRQNYQKALRVLDLLIEAMPQSADEYKQRGVIRLQLKNYGAAKFDLTRYLELSPQAEDRAEVEQQLTRIHKWLASLN